MRSRFTCSALVVILLASSVTNRLHAQTTISGGLTGVITDQSSAVVPNAIVEIRDEAKGTTQTTKTDRAGVYQFFFLAPGRYTLTALHEGFQNERRAVQVLLGPPCTVNVTLEIAKAISEITVRDDAPIIQAFRHICPGLKAADVVLYRRRFTRLRLPFEPAWKSVRRLLPG
jgi:hypothetical protein